MADDNAGAGAGAGDAGAAAGAGAGDAGAGAGNQGGGDAGGSWRTGLSTEFQADPIFKNFNSQDDALRAYKHLRSTQGLPPERIARKPADDAAPEEWNKYHEFNGRPKDEKGYKEPTIENFKFNDKATETLRKDALAAGLNQKQYESVATSFAKEAMADQQRAVAEFNTRMEATNTKMKEEWGEAALQTSNDIRRLVNGMGGEGLMAELEKSGVLANENMMRFLGKVSKNYAEAGAVGGAGGGNSDNRAMTAADAKSEIAELQATPDFMGKYRKGDGDAMAKMAKLHKYAYPEQKK